MTRIWKRSLSLFLAIVMVVGMIPFSALAADEEVIEEEVLEIFEEVPEEEIVEEIIEEEIIEEEIVEEEIFEEIVEEEVAEEEVFFQTSDEVANAAAEGVELTVNDNEFYIWVNCHEDMMTQEIMDLLMSEAGIKGAVLDAIGYTGDRDAVTVTYDGADVTGADQPGYEFSPENGPLMFANAKGEDLKNDITTPDENGKKNNAVFVVGGEGYLITFRDNRIKVVVNFSCDAIQGTGVKEDAEMETLIGETLLTVTGTDPETGNDAEVAYQWEMEYTKPHANYAGEAGSVYVKVYGVDSKVYDVKDGAIWEHTYSVYDTTPVYEIFYDVDGEVEGFRVLEGDKTPSYEEPTKKYYTFAGWSPAVADTVTKNVTYTATWKAINDNNNNKKADEEEFYNVTFFDDNEEVIVEHTDVPYGTRFSDLVPTDEQLKREGWNFKGWGKELPEFVTAPKSNSGSVSYNFFGKWTADPVVNFVSPVTGLVDQSKIVEVKEGTTVAMPSEWAWTGYYVSGWYVVNEDGSTTDYDFSQGVIKNLTLYPHAIVDTNKNKIEDGSVEDPFIDYVWVVGDEEVEDYIYLAGRDEAVDESYYSVPVSNEDNRVFVKWEAKETDGSTADRVATLITYTAVFADDFNNNEVDDENEKITVTVKGDGKVNLESGIYDSTADSIAIVATPVVENGISETYVSEIKINGTAVALDFVDFAVETALTMADYKSKVTVEVTFEDAAFTAGEGEMMVHLDGSAYTDKEVYEAVASVPAYDEQKIEVLYQSRASETIPVDVSELRKYVQTAYASMYDAFLEEYYKLADANDMYWYTYEESWDTVDATGFNTDSAQMVTDNYISKIKAMDSTDLVKVYKELGKQLNAEIATTGKHEFGNQTEIVSVSYQDESMRLYDEVALEIIDLRPETWIEATTKVVTYKQFKAEDLTAHAVLKTEDGPVAGDIYVAGNLDEIVNYGVGEYKVYLKFDATTEYKAAPEFYYILKIEPATATVTIPNTSIMVSPENGTKWHEEATPVANTDQVVHLIAGVDIESTKVNWTEGEIEEIGAKAWMKLPESLWDMLDEANKLLPEGEEIVLEDGYYKLEEIKALLTTPGLESVIPASAQEQINSALDSLTTMTEKTGNEDMDVYVNFVQGDESVFPTEIGVYVNMAVVVDQNYNTADARGMIMIHPGVAMPNSGLDLKLADEENGQNIYTFQADAVKKLIVEGDETCEVRYFGLTNNAEVHSAGAPTTPGIYVASAIKADANQNVISDAAIVIIYQKTGSVNIDNDVVTEDGSAHKPAVEANGAYTLISAEVDVGVPEAVINVDFPAGITKVLNKLKIEALPDSVTLDQAIAKIEAIPGKIEEKLADPMQTLADFDIPTDKINEYLEQGYGYFDEIVAKLNELKAELGETEVTVTFRDHKGYTKAGVYYYAAVVTDPECLPAADVGYLVIETDKFDVQKTTVTAGQDYTLDQIIKNETEHDYITVISGNGNVNVILDKEYGETIRAKLAAKFGKNLTDGIAYPVSELEGEPEPWANKLADALMEKVTELAETEIKGYSLPAKLQTYALNRLEAAMNARKEQLVNELNEQIDKYSNLTLTINGELPTEEGTYKVRALSYAVAYDAAELEIQEKLFDIYGANVKIEESLDMFFYIQKSDLDGEEYYAVITKTYADGNEDLVLTIPYSEWESYNSSLYRIKCDGIYAAEMTDTIYVTVYNSDGTPASNQWIDSIHDYALRLLKNSSNVAQKPVLVDMLNYGAAAQAYFSYNLENLATVGAEEFQQYATTDVSCTNQLVKGDNYYGTTVTAADELKLTFYFNNISTDMTAYVTYTDAYGDVIDLVIKGSDFHERTETLTGVIVPGLAVYDGRQLVSCVVKDSAGNVVASAVDSVESYAARMIDKMEGEKKAVFENLMSFVEGACVYFGK